MAVGSNTCAFFAGHSSVVDLYTERVRIAVNGVVFTHCNTFPALQVQAETHRAEVARLSRHLRRAAEAAAAAEDAVAVPPGSHGGGCPGSGVAGLALAATQALAAAYEQHVEELQQQVDGSLLMTVDDRRKIDRWKAVECMSLPHCAGMWAAVDMQTDTPVCLAYVPVTTAPYLFLYGSDLFH